MNIGVAKPSPEELNTVDHYFINSHSISDQVNAAIFEKYAVEKVQEIFRYSDIAIMVGGTGLYVKTFCEGIDDVPVILPGIREELVSYYELKGLIWLQQEVQKNDPVYFSKGEIQNPQRLLRALEVRLSTGKSIVEYQTKKKIPRDFDIIKIGLALPRPQLYHRINERVEEMIARGLTEEVQSLENFQHLNALQTVGYKELFEHLAGKTKLTEAIAAIQINTRHYAKRQMTWFKKDAAIKWCGPDLAVVLGMLNKMKIE